MRLGVLITHHPNPANPQAFSQQLKEVEDTGFDSIWIPHTVGRGIPTPDPIVTLACASAVTERVELGTAILQLPLLRRATLLHQLLSLIQVCGNRLCIGVGAGSTETDFLAHEQAYENRFKDFWSLVAELREALKVGKLENLDLSSMAPSSDSTTSIFFGTWGNGVKRAAKEFDGWIASGAYRTDDEVCAAIVRYREAGGKRAIVSSIFGVPDTKALGDRLTQFNEAGFDDAVVALAPNSPPLDEIRKLMS